MKEEDSFAESGYLAVESLDVRLSSCRRDGFEDPLLVTLRLEPADTPRAGIRHGLVVEIDGVLCRDEEPHAECSGLLEKRENRLL